MPLHMKKRKMLFELKKIASLLYIFYVSIVL